MAIFKEVLENQSLKKVFHTIYTEIICILNGWITQWKGMILENLFH